MICDAYQNRYPLLSREVIAQERRNGTQVWKPRNHELEKFQIFSCFPGFLIQISEKFTLMNRRLRLRLIFWRGGNGFVFAIWR